MGWTGRNIHEYIRGGNVRVQGHWWSDARTLWAIEHVALQCMQ